MKITLILNNCEFIGGTNLTNLLFENDDTYNYGKNVKKSELKIMNSKFKDVIFKGTLFMGVPITKCDFSNNKLEQTVFVSEIEDSNFKDSTFNGCIFGDEKRRCA